MVQVPVASIEAVVPETEQTLDVVEAKLTAKPELAVAESVRGVFTFWAGIEPKVMVCASPLTVKVSETGVAAV